MRNILSMRFLMPIILCFIFICLMMGRAHAFDVVVKKPFSGTAHSPKQIEAWQDYLNSETQKLGCSYGDDPRLAADRLMQTMRDIMDGKADAPLKMTYRTWHGLTPSVRKILSRNVVIQSMDCKPVYVYQDHLIGSPMVSFEEYLYSLLFAYRENGQESMFDVIRDIRVAPIDVRYFFAYFGVPQNRLMFMGTTRKEMEAMEARLPRLMDLNWVLNERNHKARKIGVHEEKESAYDFARIYLQLPGAYLKLPIYDPCEVVHNVLPPSLTIWPLDDPAEGLLQSSGETPPSREKLRAIRDRAKAEYNFLETSTRYELTDNVIAGAYRYAKDDIPVENQIAFNVPIVGGTQDFKLYQYKATERCR